MNKVRGRAASERAPAPIAASTVDGAPDIAGAIHSKPVAKLLGPLPRSIAQNNAEVMESKVHPKITPTVPFVP
jgi:hypothetical protein